MGSVLAFVPRDAAADRKPIAAGVTASIVIFPGIRYERHDDTPEGAPTKGAARNQKPKH